MGITVAGTLPTNLEGNVSEPYSELDIVPPVNSIHLLNPGALVNCIHDLDLKKRVMSWM